MTSNPTTSTKQWRDLSDDELESMYLSACAEGIQWLIDSYKIEDDRLLVTGWAIAHTGRPERAQFLINGMPFEETEYPIASPDVGEFFWNVPAAQTSRFDCKTRIDWEHTFQHGFARLEFFAEGSDREQARRRAWYLPNPQDDLPVPDPARVRRVISVPDPMNYLIGGAAIYKRLEHYLHERFSKTFDDFPQILDFGCGCGRVTRHFRWAKRAKVTGVDIDRDNVAWCKESLPHAQFVQTQVLPPLPFANESFDLVIAISVLSQLMEKQQLLWLRELRRVAKQGALVIAALPGLPQMGLSRPHPSLLRDVEEKGYVSTGRSPDLDDVLPQQNHYISGIHSRRYLHEKWSRFFSIGDTIDAMAANHDLIVMINDRPESERRPEPAARPELNSGNPFAVPLRDYDINPFIHPSTVKSGYGGHIVDMNGTDYVDFTSAWGTNLLGYGYRRVARAAARQAKRFNSLGLPYPEFHELKTLFRKLVPSAEEVRYGKNGSDACAGAVRLARFITGREKMLYRGYHGFHDWYFASTDCPGIPVALKSTILPQAELTPAAVDVMFNEHPEEIAGLILNPLAGPIPAAEEIREVVEVVHRHGGLVIFDEMMSGFRVAPGGMQEIWGVQPDMSCFGKSIANGLPLAVLCGKSEYIRRLPETYYGMTFEGEAVSIAAAYATLTEVIEKNVVAELYAKGRQIRAAYARLAGAHNISTSLVGYEPCMHLDFAPQAGILGRELLWLMIQELVRHSVFTCGAFILCFSHDRKDLRKLEAAFDAAFAVLKKAVASGTTEGLLNRDTRERLGEIHSPAKWRHAATS